MIDKAGAVLIISVTLAGITVGAVAGQWWTDRQWRIVNETERRISDIRMQTVAEACDIRIFNVLTRVDRSGCFGTWTTADGAPMIEPDGRKVAKR